MQSHTSIVITSIANPNAVLESIAAGCRERGLHFYVIGDISSPADFCLNGCDFYSVERQVATGLRFAELCPKRHYARKNIGYLLAIRDGACTIVETDDDNFPRESFWRDRTRTATASVVTQPGWVNVYRYFSDTGVWPRGLPLDAVQTDVPALERFASESVDAPIQQGLADDNPDVDAIYRLTLPLPLQFAPGRQVALGNGVWCPFNSQNTTWWPDAYALLYLPSSCSFRMTDIWRSFVAQRIAWENGWSILFESPTVWQERNDHNLLRDFKDEIPGYLNNRSICEKLEALSLKPGVANIAENLAICYESFVRGGHVDVRELELLETWLTDLRMVASTAA